MPTAQIMYPCMQCADIFHLKADICQLGMDQRKVNMLAREYCDIKQKKFKPVILSHHMLLGLKEGQAKMSKSDPESAIFMEDTEASVNLKIKKAFCPPKIIQDNPCFDYIKYLVFPKFGQITVKRSEDFGGDKTYTTYDEIESNYIAGDLHPNDVKPALAKAINEMIASVRAHFETNEEAKKLLKIIKSYKVAA